MFVGVCTALITPFTEDLKVDYETFKKQIDFQIEHGVKTLLFLGTTGEATTIDLKEKIQIVKFATKYVAGRAKIVVGAGSNNTAESIYLCRQYEKIGKMDAFLIVTPYYNKCSQKGLINHYTKIADCVKVPIIMYNVPSRTGVNILPKTVEILCKHKNIIGIKEASGNVSQIMEIAKLINSNFELYSGDDNLTYLVMSVGGKGVISVASNIIPKQMCEMCNLFFEGNVQKSLKKQLFLNDFIKKLFSDVNPIPVKTIMKYAKMDTGILRLPLTTMDKSLETELIDSYKLVLDGK